MNGVRRQFAHIPFKFFVHLDKKERAQIVFTLHSYEGNNLIATDRRRYNRYNIQQEISYILHASHFEKIHTGIINNMSSSEMCLHISNPVSLVHEITIKQEDQYEDQYYVKGTVLWCKRMGDKLHPYRVGLKFGPQIGSDK